MPLTFVSPSRFTPDPEPLSIWSSRVTAIAPAMSAAIRVSTPLPRSIAWRLTCWPEAIVLTSQTRLVSSMSVSLTAPFSV